MSKAYTVGRGSAADIKIPKQHDAVGKLHIEIEDLGGGQARVTDLRSTNGTFVNAGNDWEEITSPRVVDLDSSLMLGDFRTTPRSLLAAASRAAEQAPPPEPKAPPPLPGKKKRSGPRRNEFGEIVHE
jgi:hypothetical protein